MVKRRSPELKYCSFCHKGAKDVKRLLAGPAGIAICDGCVGLCTEIINSDKGIGAEARPIEQRSGRGLPSPREIHRRLDEYVIGHEAAKKVLAVAVFNHYQRLAHQAVLKSGDVELEKSNILLLGDTGTGKTLLARTLARIVDVPFAMADATTLTEAGYVGEDVENILLKLIQAAGGDIRKAEKGMVFIDEIDKISRKSESASITRDVSGEGVQQALLKIVEGTMANVPPQGGRKHPEQAYLQIDTTNILFICGGAFDGLNRIIGRRVGKRSIGFSSTPSASRKEEDREILRKVEPDDLLKYGLIPELVGRLPVACVLDSLDKAAFLRILSEPRNAILRQYIRQYEMMGVELGFDKAFLDLVVDAAHEKSTGARALRSIMEKYMTPLTYELASSQCRPSAIKMTLRAAELDAESFLKETCLRTPTFKKAE